MKIILRIYKKQKKISKDINLDNYYYINNIYNLNLNNSAQNNSFDLPVRQSVKKSTFGFLDDNRLRLKPVATPRIIPQQIQNETIKHFTNNKINNILNNMRTCSSNFEIVCSNI